ncbi:MAG: RnfABCDGE type electron transport complex subunit G [archaeon]
MRELIKSIITLTTVATVAGFVLALTNDYTAPLIEMQKQLVIQESLNKVIIADSFLKEEKYYNAYDKNEQLVGRVLKVETPGYSSLIVVLAGIDLENKITGIDVITHQETPGIGSNIEKDYFLEQFVGKSKDELELKKYGGKIDAVTGATISSRAVTDGVRKMVETYPCTYLEED